MSVCRFPSCVWALPEGDQYCPVHNPAEVLRRVRAILDARFGGAQEEDRITSGETLRLRALHKRILEDIGRTI